MIVTTAIAIPGKEIVEVVGIVRGIVVRSPNVGQNLLGGLQGMLGGGDVEKLAEMCEQARQESHDRMVQHAEKLGADAVVSMRYDATEYVQSMTEVLAYGTAVKLRR